MYTTKINVLMIHFIQKNLKHLKTNEIVFEDGELTN